MPIYNKLVRDLIPEIIEKSGKQCTTHILTDGDYIHALDKKLDEELAEYHAADHDHALEELADLLEVIRAVVVARGYSVDDVETIRMEKAKKRGGFSAKIMLEEVSDPLY